MIVAAADAGEQAPPCDGRQPRRNSASIYINIPGTAADAQVAKVQTRSHPLSLLIEKSEVPRSVLQPKPHADRPKPFRFQRTLLPVKTDLVPGNILHDCLRRADRALPSSRQSATEANLSKRRLTGSIPTFVRECPPTEPDPK